MANQIPQHILNSIKKYEKNANMTCLECGYSGLMGICKVNEPPKYKYILVMILWSIIALVVFVELGVKSNIFFLVSVFVGYVCAEIYDFMNTINYYECPNCNKTLKQKS